MTRPWWSYLIIVGGACPAVLYFVRLKESKLHNHFGGLIPHSFIIPTTTRTPTIS
jgi:hypothetical protein